MARSIEREREPVKFRIESGLLAGGVIYGPAVLALSGPPHWCARRLSRTCRPWTSGRPTLWPREPRKQNAPTGKMAREMQPPDGSRGETRTRIRRLLLCQQYCCKSIFCALQRWPRSVCGRQPRPCAPIQDRGARLRVTRLRSLRAPLLLAKRRPASGSNPCLANSRIYKIHCTVRARVVQCQIKRLEGPGMRIKRFNIVSCVACSPARSQPWSCALLSARPS